MRILDEITASANNNSIKHIDITHGDCENLDLAASLVMDIALMRARKRRRVGNSLAFSGCFSTKSDIVNVMLKASGIPHHLGLPEARLDPAIEKLIHRAELKSGTSNKNERGHKRNEAGGYLTNYFDNCLLSLGYTLNKKGKQYLGNLLTEVIGNAEEHGGGKWYTIGHWHRGQHGEAKKFGRCHIVIMNYGTTIHESLAGDSVSPQLQSDLKQLSDLHRQRKLFGKEWDEGTLWTLYALQERVSRYAGLPGSQDRGNGSIEVIEFFRKLSGDAHGRMTIISGNAYILFDGTYHLGPIQRNGETLQVIAFNDENDLQKAPDRKYVFRLPSYFPGTIVSIELTLEEEYLATQVKK